MAAMILCVLVMLALCVLKLVKRTDYRRESDYFYENDLDEYGENEAYTSEYPRLRKAFFRTGSTSQISGQTHSLKGQQRARHQNNALRRWPEQTFRNASGPGAG